MKLNQIRDNKGATQKPKVLGRGIGCTKGKTCGKGHKGQKARSSGAVAVFEGGQTPIYRRLPKRGFNSHKKKPFELTFEKLSSFIKHGLDLTESKQHLTLTILKEKNFVPVQFDRIKMIDSKEGDVPALTYVVDAISKGARAKIEKSGGKIQLPEERSK